MCTLLRKSNKTILNNSITILVSDYYLKNNCITTFYFSNAIFKIEIYCRSKLVKKL